MEQIALIRLQAGQGGYYDELSRIHLTLGSPEAPVYAGTNCTQLRRSVRAGRLKLVSGSLGEEKQPTKVIEKSKNITVGNFIPKAKTKKAEQAKVEAVKSTDKATETKATVKDNKTANKVEAKPIISKVEVKKAEPAKTNSK